MNWVNRLRSLLSSNQKAQVSSSLHGNSWSEKKRVEAATAHAMGLSAPMIAAATGVPAQTIRHWRMADWFKDLVEEIRREDDNTVDAKLTKIVSKSLDSIVDRLENGDFMFDKEIGQFVRRPVNTKDMTRIADVMFDKRNLLRGKPTAISVKTEQISDRLLKIAAEFEKFVTAKVIEAEVITDDTNTRQLSEVHADEVHTDEVETPPRVHVDKAEESAGL